MKYEPIIQEIKNDPIIQEIAACCKDKTAAAEEAAKYVKRRWLRWLIKLATRPSRFAR